MSKYKTVLFDLDNTLMDFDSAAQTALLKTMQKTGVDDAFDDTYRCYKSINAKLWDDFEKQLLTSEELRVERFRKLANVRQWSPQDWHKFSDIYLHFLSRQTALFPDTMNILSHLESNYLMGIVTNGIPAVQHERMTRSPIASFFKALIISGEHNTSKPDPLIFKIALEKLGSNRHETLYVGDSISSDMRGAENAGIDFCWYDPACQKAENDYVFQYKIECLSELVKILD